MVKGSRRSPHGNPAKKKDAAMFLTLSRNNPTLKMLLAGLAFAATASHAAVTTFFNPANIVSGTDYFFNEHDPGPGMYRSFLGDPVPVTGSGVSFKASESIVFGVGYVGYDPDIVYSAKTDDPLSVPNALTANVSGAVKTIGFYLGSYNHPGTAYSAVVTAGGSDYSFSAGLSLPAAPLSFGFIGFTSPASITKVVFTQSETLNALDVQKFSTSSVVAVPEPSAYAMFGAGLALFGMIGLRRRRR